VIKRYWYIVWRLAENDHLLSGIFDMEPAEWLIRNRVRFLDANPIIIVNQFEITAEQYNALESLQ